MENDKATTLKENDKEEYKSATSISDQFKEGLLSIMCR